MATELLFSPTSTAAGRIDRWPAWRTVGYTLNISVRFLASCMVGRGSLQRADELLNWYWRKILNSGNATLMAEGREHFVRGAAHVVMSNHSSILDIPILMGAVPGSVRMVTKEELCKVPVWGKAMVKSGFIPIDRRNREKAIGQLERAKEILLQGVNVWIAPEGTRSRDGKLGDFKKGGFYTALGLGAPIVPTWIHGASDIIPPDQFVARYGGTAVVRFGPPISTLGMTADDIPTLMLRVRQAMLELAAWRPSTPVRAEARA
jgi:1-acyl-sn-glycerol-3-phosphate acyltransferase